MQSLSAVAMLFQDTATLSNDVHSLMIAEWVIAICVLLVIVALLGAAIAAVVAIRALQKKVDQTTKTVQAKAMPLIGQGQDLLAKVQAIVADLQPKIADISEKVQGIIADTQPKVASVTSDVEHISGVVKSKVDEISSAVTRVVGDVGQTVTRVSDQVGDTVVKVSGQVSETVAQVNSTVQDVNGKTQAQVARVNGMVSDVLTSTEHVSKSIQHGIRVPVDKVVGWVAAAKSGIESLVEKTPFGAKPAPRRVPTPIRTTTVAPGGPPFVPSDDDSKRPM